MLLDESATLDIWHKTFRSENSSHGFERWHMLGSCNDLVKGNIALPDFFQNSVVANKVSPCGFALLMELIASEDTHFDSLTSASGEQARVTDVLVTLCWVDI